MEDKHVGPGGTSAILFRVFSFSGIAKLLHSAVFLFLFALSFEIIQAICRSKKPVNASFAKIKSW